MGMKHDKNRQDKLFELTGLTNEDLVDILKNNSRAYMAVKGAVAEKHLEKYLKELKNKNKILSYEKPSGDSDKDFVVKNKSKKYFDVECKNVEVIKTNNKEPRWQYIVFLYNKGYVSFSQLIGELIMKKNCAKF